MERERHLELMITPDQAARLYSFHGAAEEQMWMCAFCEQAPASVRCKADDAALCLACDDDIHFSNPFALRHERLPLHNPSTKPPVYDDDGFLFGSVNGDKLESPWWLLPEPPMEIRLAAPHRFSAEYASLADVSFGQADSIVPGQGEPKLPSNNGVVEINFAQIKPLNYSDWVLPDAATMDREARVMRYREKRKNRQFQKTIRYASRKAYAETRPREKGRFAKRACCRGFLRTSQRI